MTLIKGKQKTTQRYPSLKAPPLLCLTADLLGTNLCVAPAWGREDTEGKGTVTPYFAEGKV